MAATMLDEALASLGDRRVRFVFPSEIAAASTLVELLARSGRRALPARRFVGWDAFKSEVFAGDAAGRPSTKAIRSIFARMLMADNARSPFLRAIVPQARASASERFAPSVASALPALRSVPDGQGDLVADWREIRRRYAAFLAERGLYEAAWLGRSASAEGERWVLFYPDLTEDWDDYAGAVTSIPDARVILSAELGRARVKAARFGTAVEEARAVLQRIRAEAEAGADPAGMMISVASPESALPILEREARIAGVPLEVREGRPLADSAGGRLFADIVGLARSRVSFESARRLLLDGSRPWKEADEARRLLGIGIRKHVVAPLPEGADVWEASIGSDDGARRLYRGLRTASAKVAEAKGFKALRAAFDAFRRAFIDEAAWSPLQNDEIARCLAELDGLADAAAVIGLAPDGFAGAADAYLRQLADTKYLPVSNSGGIAVYRFPVAAGAYPAMHFVINLAQGAAAAAARPLSFMRADEREKAGAADRDISAGLIRLLSLSGERVFPSFSEDGPDGIRPPHQAVDARDPAELGLPYDRERWLPNLEADAIRGEAFPIQAASAKAALATVFPPEGADWSTGAPDSPVVMEPKTAAAIAAMLTRDGVLKLSATAIEGYGTCAFRRIFGSALKVKKTESGLSFIDALLIGGIYHDAFRLLLKPLAEARVSVVAGPGDDGAPGDGGPGGAAGESARPSTDDMRAAIASAIASVVRDSGPMAGILVGTAAPVLERCFMKAAANLVDAIDGLTPVLVDEDDLSAPLPTIGAELFGRPDLVCIEGFGGERPRAVIVDYKKKSLPSKLDIKPDENGDVAAIQIPAYAMLVSEAGFDPQAAYYLSIEGSGPRGKGRLLVFGPGDKPVISPEELETLGAALEAAAARTATTIRRGDVFLPVASERDPICDSCDLRPVCRVHYAVR